LSATFFIQVFYVF